MQKTDQVTIIPAWKSFNKKIKSGGDVGIWHETYKVKAGQYECVYNNMPPYGLGKAGELIDAIGKREYVHPDKAEMLCLHAMIASARIMVDPRQRGAQ
ncbi:MAG TPA: DUF4188 domain-containing protein [Chitinophagaceae bacterium]|nr:DUF4188 domain-containing protein [Chitinophagaceae bacterium]